MALVNPNIAMGYRGIELPNQLAQYSQLSQIQNAQNQNSLAQYQLGAAQRAEAKDIARTNALASAGADEGAIASALLKIGDIKAYSDFLKNQQERKTQALTQQKTESELFDTSMKQIRNSWGNVRTPEEALAIHDATHRDPVINKRLAALGISEQMGRQQIIDAARDPSSFAQFVQKAQLGAEKFMEMNKPQLSTKDTGSEIQDRLFEPLTRTITPLGTTAKSMTPGETASNKVAQGQLTVAQQNAKLAQDRFAFDKTNEGQSVTYQQDVNGNIVALPTKVRPGDVPRGRSVVAPGEGMTPMAGKPSEAAAKETASLNQQNAIVAGALDAIKKNPDAFGTARGVAGGVLGETFGSRAVGETPEETQARSFLFNVVSGVIKERAGTAQSAGEQATLNRFLPTTTDNADELTAKLKGFQNYLTARESAGKKPGGANPPALSGIDQQALQWANSNPADPRAAAIKQRLGR